MASAGYKKQLEAVCTAKGVLEILADNGYNVKRFTDQVQTIFDKAIATEYTLKLTQKELKEIFTKFIFFERKRDIKIIEVERLLSFSILLIEEVIDNVTNLRRKKILADLLSIMSDVYSMITEGDYNSEEMAKAALDYDCFSKGDSKNGKAENNKIVT